MDQQYRKQSAGDDEKAGGYEDEVVTGSCVGAGMTYKKAGYRGCEYSGQRIDAHKGSEYGAELAPGRNLAAHGGG